MIRLSLLSILLLAGIASSQFDSVDYFGPISCDDMLARVDSLSVQLRNDPTYSGYVVVSGGHEHLIKKLQLEILFTSAAIQRRVDPSRITLVRGDERGEPRMSFYLLQPGVRSPMAAAQWNLSIPMDTKPLLLAWDEDGICSYPTVYKYLREVLAANQQARLNVVLADASSRKFRRHAADIRDIIGASNTRRIRFFHDRHHSTVSADFWIVP